MKILITIWGPEFGCLFRQIEIAKRFLADGCEVKFIAHERHRDVLTEQFGKESIIDCFSWKIIKYNKNNDLDFFVTILSYFRFIICNLFFDYLNFRFIVKRNKFDFVITDFIPHNIIYCRFLGIKCISVFNYALVNDNINTSLYFSIIHGFARKCFSLLYKSSSLCFIETMYKTKEKKRVLFMGPIALHIQKDRQFLNRELGVKQERPFVFYSLGGGFFKYEKLFKLDELAGKFDDFYIFVMPRDEEEIIFLRNRLKNVLCPENLILSPSQYIYNADIIITKCGFRTIVDAIRNKCRLLPMHTPMHPEIFETQRFLEENGIAKHIFYDIDEENLSKISLLLNDNMVTKTYEDISFCDIDSLTRDILFRVKSENYV